MVGKPAKALIFSLLIQYQNLKSIPVLSPKYKLLQKLVVLLVLAFLTLAIGCPGCLKMPLQDGVFGFGYSLAMCLSLWLGNDLLTDTLDKRLPWLRNPGKRLLVSLISTVVISVLIVFCVNFIFLLIRDFTMVQLVEYHWGPVVLFPLLVTFFITLIVHSRSFFLGWRQTAIDAERWKGENIISQYETLKNQVNPHFLFNSLNTLTSLVHIDPDLSVKFIKQLSEVYRYVLDSQNKEVVDLATEIKFVHSYVFLQQIRFGENLRVTINVPANSTIQIAPLSLQMLLENAIKHNIIVEDEPLLIHIYLEGHQYIVVKNNLQVKNMGVESSGLGLKNIKARYEYLTNKPMHIEQTEAKFIVKLPVLNLKKA